MAELLPYFCVFHINAPGQEEAAEKLPEEFVYPNMEELSEQVRLFDDLIPHFHLHIVTRSPSITIPPK